jgi:hypothetical protein
MSVTPEVQNALNAARSALDNLGAAVGAAPTPVGPPIHPDQGAKSPLPTPGEDLALSNSVGSFLDQTFPITGKPTPSMYPQASKLHDANVYIGTTLEKVTNFYRSCFGTGAYGATTGAPMVSNNQARTAAFDTGHDHITDLLITYCSFVTAPLPEKNQLV